MNKVKASASPSQLGDHIEAVKSVEVCQFATVSKIMDELLDASEGLQQLGDLLIASDKNNVGYLITSMGKYVQNLRNQAACELNPIYESFEVNPISF